MIRFRWRLFAALLSLPVAGCGALEVTALNFIETTEFAVEGEALMMTGEVNSRTLGQFRDVMAAHPDIEVLVLLDVPGSIDDDTNLALGHRVREAGLQTHLRSTSYVASGGVDLFLAGVRRTMEEGAVLGVHGWADLTSEAADYPPEAPEHDTYVAYTRRMLGSDAFYWFTIHAAPSESIHEMSSSEIARYGLLTELVRAPKEGWR